MKTKTYTTYKFNELPAEAKAKVLKNNHDINTEENWYEYYFDEVHERLEDLGYNNVDISFSGFWSQGDGASFTADIDLIKWLKEHKRLSYYKKLIKDIDSENIYGNIKRIDNYYSHYNTCNTSIYGSYLTDEKFKLVDQLMEEIESERRQLCKEIYKQLEKAYDYLTSEEAIIETLEANDYDFTLDGKID